jgi:ubiquinone/menaquinone biosynthesis C-methylase UbiE
MGKKSTSGIYDRFAKKGVFPPQMAFTLLIPARNLIFSPKQLISRLNLRCDSHVLEVGPGPGYFSTHIAGALNEGKLVLADIQQEMLEKAKKRILRKQLSNVEFYLCNGDNFLLPDESFDVIFLVTVIGEIENKNAYIKEFHRMLKSGGILSISELRGDPDKLTIAEVKELLADSGFVFDRLFGNENNYTINFKKE